MKAVNETKDAKNGITRPQGTGATGKVWLIADKLSKKMKAPVPRAQVMEAALIEGVNPATISTQYQRWRVYNGLAKPVANKPKATTKAKPKAKAKDTAKPKAKAKTKASVKASPKRLPKAKATPKKKTTAKKAAATTAKRRGRPPGSTNKPKSIFDNAAGVI